MDAWSSADDTMVANTTRMLDAIRKKQPLVHNITNFVVMNSSANTLLALGASPVMAHAKEEVEAMTGLADVLVLNIGTLEPDWVEAMMLAARAANRKGIPVVLDPVGAGATAYRTQTARRILSETGVAVLRGNASEILSLTSGSITTRGVDSSVSLANAQVGDAMGLARDLGCVVAISGAEDCITDGQSVYRVRNGHPAMTRVTGTGCGLSAVVGAFCAVDADPARAAAAAFGVYGLCGKRAVERSRGPGSFPAAFLDALSLVTPDDIAFGLRIERVC